MPYGRICIDVSQRRNEYDWGIFPPLFPEIYRPYRCGCGGQQSADRLRRVRSGAARPGTSNKVLEVVSTLDRVEYDEETNTTLFRLVVTCGRKNALELTKANFAVKADGYLADQNNKLEVTSPDALSHQVKQGETVTYHVMARGLNALTDGPVTLTFYPDLQYPEFNANWELAAEVLEPDLSDPSTT